MFLRIADAFINLETVTALEFLQLDEGGWCWYVYREGKATREFVVDDDTHAQVLLQLGVDLDDEDDSEDTDISPDKGQWAV